MPIDLADPSLLVPLFALGLVMVGAGLIVRRWTRFAAQREKRLAAAKPATARVTRVGKSYTYRNDPHVCLLIEFSVQPQWGRAYESSAAWKIDPQHVNDIRAGTRLPVKVDADLPGTVFPDVPWAEYDWANEDVTRETEPA